MTDLIEVMARALCRAEYGPEIEDGRLIISGPEGDLPTADAINDYVDRMWDCFIDHARSALSALEAAGWRVVPVELTKEMLQIGWHDSMTLDEIWEEFLAAAPKVTDQT